MVRLRRIVRFTINPIQADQQTDPADAEDAAPVWRNGYAGAPAMSGLGTHYSLLIECLGRPDPNTGYLVNIKDIDTAARATVIPAITEAFHNTPMIRPETLLAKLAEPLDSKLGGITKSLRWNLSPTYSVEVSMNDTNQATLRQRFDFAASHRLHVATLSDEENRKIFGVCNNINGHGHNYQVEPCVALDLSDDGAHMSLADLEAVVGETVIDRFDHRNLNVDTREFRDGEGVNPSVEHIARVCFGLLEPVIASRWSNARLRNITVWETDRTCCTFPGE